MSVAITLVGPELEPLHGHARSSQQGIYVDQHLPWLRSGQACPATEADCADASTGRSAQGKPHRASSHSMTRPDWDKVNLRGEYVPNSSLLTEPGPDVRI